MIGPRHRGGAITARSGGIRASSTRKRSRSPSSKKEKGNDDKEKKEKSKKEKSKSEFAWMDSDDESDASKKSDKSAASSSSPVKPVPLKEVQTLGQMARQAPELERRLKKGDVKPKELVEAAAALARSKFFDAGLLEPLHKELARACRKGHLGASEMLAALCDLAELNAYEKRFFQDACEALSGEVNRLPEADRKRLEAALKRVNHDPGNRFFESLRTPRHVGGGGNPNSKEPCPLFFRGQCKWGPKCKLSHDDAAYDRAMSRGEWKPPSESGGKSRGFSQSSDLFAVNRVGALW